MKYDMRQRGLNFWLTLTHLKFNSVMGLSNINSESIVTLIKFLLKLAARGIPLIEPISGFLLLSKVWDFQD